MIKPYQKKWHDECVLFLDDCFSSDKAIQELSPHFRVEDFRVHFADPHKKGKTAGVPDKLIIELCHKQKWLLLTMDHEMRKTHTEDIKRNHDVTILATATNPATPEENEEWLKAVIKLKPTILRFFKKKPRPWFAVFSREGNITSFNTITVAEKSRRTRKK